MTSNAIDRHAWPDIDPDLADYLKRTFPPKCYDPPHETLEDHLLYAGQVRLAEVIISAYEAQVEDAKQADEYYNA